MAEIATLLEGAAAEEELIGDRGEGAGGAEGSDLRLATTAACRLELSHGLGGRLTACADAGDGRLEGMLASDPAARARVEGTLGACMDMARAVLRAHRSRLVALSGALAAPEGQGSMSFEDFASLDVYMEKFCGVASK